jgi:hypothetical protein
MTVSEPDKSKIWKHVLTEEETYDSGAKLEECPKITCQAWWLFRVE